MSSWAGSVSPHHSHFGIREHDSLNTAFAFLLSGSQHARFEAEGSQGSGVEGFGSSQEQDTFFSNLPHVCSDSDVVPLGCGAAL